jgi:hypothetical protein
MDFYFSTSNKNKNRGAKGQEGKRTKDKTTGHVLAMLEIQNKLMSEQD